MRYLFILVFLLFTACSPKPAEPVVIDQTKLKPKLSFTKDVKPPTPAEEVRLKTPSAEVQHHIKKWEAFFNSA